MLYPKMYQICILLGILIVDKLTKGNASVMLKTTDGVWGAFLLERKILVCQSNKFPLTSCVIKEGTEPLKSINNNLEAGRCDAEVTLYEFDPRKKYSCEVVSEDNVAFKSGSFHMRILNNRKIPQVQITTTSTTSNTDNITLHKQALLNLHCKYPIDDQDPENEYYYIKWKIEIMKNNPVIEGKFNKTTEIILITVAPRSVYRVSNMTLNFDPNILITAVKANCSLYHAEFGDKVLSSAHKNIIQKYPTSLVRITNTSVIWAPKGGEISLRCIADGNPAPSFQWIKKVNDKEVQKLSNATNSELIISNVLPEDAALYGCWAKNTFNPPNNWIESDNIKINVSGGTGLSVSITTFLIAITALALQLKMHSIIIQ